MNRDFAVAQLFDSEFDETGEQYREAPEPRRWVGVAVAAGLAVAGVASAFVWHAWRDSLPALPSFASVTAPVAAPPADAPDKTVGLKDFQAFQQQIAGTMQSTAQLLAAQQAEIKRLSDQVSTLTAKIDALQRPAASAQAAIPPHVAPVARKKPAAPKPAPAISTGGAPLPVTPSR